jgi:LuxR family maltose regulon positive regulatory protein
MLERLERANLFLVPLDGERRWYRYHQLFASALRDQLRRAQPDQTAELHHRAAEWFERNGFVADAVGHALAVGDNDQAVRLVEQIAESLWMRGEMVQLLGWLEALPDEIIRARPRLCIFHAWILNILCQPGAVQARLEDAERGLASATGDRDADKSLLRGMLMTIRAIVAIMAGDVTGAMAYSRQALADLPEDNLIWRSVVLRNLGNAYLLTGQTGLAAQTFAEAVRCGQQAGNLYIALVSMYELAELHIIRGRLREAAQVCGEALQIAAEHGAAGMLLTGAMHVGLAEVLREWNAVEAGTREALAGIELGQRGRSVGIQVCGYTRLGMLAQARGDSAGAAEAFKKAMHIVPAHRRTSYLAHNDVQARLWWRQGDLEAVAGWLQSRGIRAGGEITHFDEAAYLTLAHVLSAQGKPGEALMLLDQLRIRAEAAERTGRLIEILILQAVSLHRQGQSAWALEALERALALAEPEGYVRSFVDEGEGVRQMLSAIRNRSSVASALRTYAARLLSLFDPASTTDQSLLSSDGALVEPLSERELEILRLIASGHSGQEIAQNLFLAVSTVQWHVKNLYSKLDVHSRTQAIARARDLKLLA